MAVTLTSRVFPLPQGVTGSATFSADHRYRYVLWRDWSLQPALIRAPGRDRLFAAIGMNPSAAAADVDDQTIRLLWRWAQRLGFDRFAMLNAYGLRSTDPRALVTAGDPIGPDNDDHLLRVACQADAIVACWGSIPAARAFEIGRLLRHAGVALRCIGRTKHGQPLHPLHQRLPVSVEALAPL